MTTPMKIKRKAVNLYQFEVAKRSGVALRTYSRYETGKRIPSAVVAQRIASVLNCTVDELYPLNSPLSQGERNTCRGELT